MTRPRSRRTFLAGLGGVGLGALAGCAGFESVPIRSAPSVLSDRPGAVYVPTHVEGMAMVGRTTASWATVALTYSYPHRFWTVTGTERERVDIGSDDTVHLMTTVWDEETGTVFPTATATATLRKDGETVTERSLWPMLAQNMGSHFGDNLALSGEGTYDVEVSIAPVQARRTGTFRNRFDDRVTASFAFEFSRKRLNEIPYRTMDDRAGEQDAVDPMEMEMLPLARTPRVEDLPGTLVGTGTSGDAGIVAARLEEPPAGIDGDGPYLAVSPRTPYHRYPLALMALSATVAEGGGGSQRFDGALPATLDPALGYHYGAVVPGLESGDRLTVTVDAPPQVARHEGYEMAFLDMPPVELTVP